MTNVIAQNMNNIQDKILEQVKVSFFNMLPDEAFKKLVDDEIDKFFNSSTTDVTLVKVDSGYNPKYELKYTGISPFALIVWTELMKVARVRLKELLDDPEFGKDLVIDEESATSFKDSTLKRQEFLLESMTKNLFKGLILEAANVAKQDVHNAIVNNNIHQLLNRY